MNELMRVPKWHNVILQATVGSTAHGLNLEGSDDRDVMGVCIEPVEAAMGFSQFEQYIYRTAALREGKHDAPSRAGDLDVTIYSLKKFLRLALQGNPSVLLLLFIPGIDCEISLATGRQMQELYPHIVSRRSGKRFLGYMESQRQRLMGEIGQKKVNRPELEEKYGYDTKYAMHILRLGYQGVELMSTGRLTLPIQEDTRSFIMSVRKGEVPIQDVLQKAGDLERELKDLLDTSPLASEPNTALVEDWMIETYWQWWKAQRYVPDQLKLYHDEFAKVH